MKESLLIVGNGFDLNHGIKSSFADFKKWLIERFEINDEEIHGEAFYNFPGYYTNYKSLVKYDERAFAIVFIKLIDKATNNELDWKEFENSLAYIDWKSVMDDNAFENYDTDGHLDAFKTENNYSAIGHLILEGSDVLKNFFKSWAKQLEDNLPTLPKDVFTNIQNINYFLSFNYTSTLETLYKIGNVTHIHGYLRKMEEPIFGHNFNEYINFYESPEKYEANVCLNEIIRSYKKDTKSAIDKHSTFFNSLVDLRSIYIFGFSFGDSDLCYIKLIMSKAKKLEKVYLNSHKIQNFPEFKQKLIECGCKATIEEWQPSVNCTYH